MNIRERLSLVTYPFDRMPEAFIDLIFNPDKHTTMEYMKQVGTDSPHTYQQLGESVIRMIATQALLESSRPQFKDGLPLYHESPGRLTNLRDIFLSDNTLYCLMMERYVVKTPADKGQVAIVLKQLVGLLYYYLEGVRLFRNSFEIIYGWFTQVFRIDRLIKELGGELHCEGERPYPIVASLPDSVVYNPKEVWSKPKTNASPFQSVGRMCTRSANVGEPVSANGQVFNAITRGRSIYKCYVVPEGTVAIPNVRPSFSRVPKAYRNALTSKLVQSRRPS